MKLKLTSSLFALVILLQLQAQAQCTINVAIQQYPDTICTGASFTLSAVVGTTGVNYAWTGPAGYSNTGQNITLNNITTAQAGTYKVLATKTGCPADSDTIVINIHISPAIPTILSNAPICIGDTLRTAVIPQNGQIGKKPYIWGPMGFSDTFFASAIAAADKNNAGLYRAVITDTFGCVSDTGKLTIPTNKINTRPATPVATGPSPVCSGDTVKLFSTSILTGEKYNWSGPASLSFNTQDVIILNYTLVGKNRFILVVDSNGCNSVPDTVDIDVYPKATPTVTISASPGFIVGPNVPVTLTANPKDTGVNIQYQWRINGQDVPGATNKTFTVTTLVDIQQGDAISVWLSTTPTCAAKDSVTSPPVVININLGVDEIAGTDHIHLYPNPVKKVLIVPASDIEEQITITNITGQKMQLPFEKSLNKVYINTSALPDGVYILQSGMKQAKFLKQN